MCSMSIFLWNIKLQKQDQTVKLTESPCKSHDGIQDHSLDPTSELIITIIKTRELFNCKHCLSLHIFYYSMFFLHRAAPLEKNSANIFPMTILKLIDSGVMHTRL